MTLAMVTICESIAALDVEGVTIKDIDQVPPDCTRLVPVLFPEPLNFLTDFIMARNSFGGGSTAKMTVDYNLHYTFCLIPIGAGRTGLDYYDKLLTKVAAILDEVLAIDVVNGAIDLIPESPIEFGPVPDPAGNQYLGCRFVFHVQEFVN